jgi:hypothetical protein
LGGAGQTFDFRGLDIGEILPLIVIDEFVALYQIEK